MRPQHNVYTELHYGASRPVVRRSALGLRRLELGAEFSAPLL
jgi:hypothetical protein